jgi:hypothetical protein
MSTSAWRFLTQGCIELIPMRSLTGLQLDIWCSPKNPGLSLAKRFAGSKPVPVVDNCIQRLQLWLIHQQCHFLSLPLGIKRVFLDFRLLLHVLTQGDPAKPTDRQHIVCSMPTVSCSIVCSMPTEPLDGNAPLAHREKTSPSKTPWHLTTTNISLGKSNGIINDLSLNALGEKWAPKG